MRRFAPLAPRRRSSSSFAPSSCKDEMFLEAAELCEGFVVPPCQHGERPSQLGWNCHHSTMGAPEDHRVLERLRRHACLLVLRLDCLLLLSSAPCGWASLGHPFQPKVLEVLRAPTIGGAALLQASNSPVQGESAESADGRCTVVCKVWTGPATERNS